MSPPGRKLERVLIVEDNVALRVAIARLVRSWGSEPLEAGTAREAKALLDPPPDLIIIDVRLPDEPIFSVLEAVARLSPAPVKVAISGEASPEEAFRLAQHGVRSYLAKPLSLDDLTRAVEAACNETPETPELDSLITDFVGHMPMREVQGRVRHVMIKQALALADGSRSGAARLLDVTRQAVQQMLRGAASRRPPSDDPTASKPPPGPSAS